MHIQILVQRLRIAELSCKRIEPVEGSGCRVIVSGAQILQVRLAGKSGGNSKRGRALCWRARRNGASPALVVTYKSQLAAEPLAPAARGGRGPEPGWARLLAGQPHSPAGRARGGRRLDTTMRLRQRAGVSGAANSASSDARGRSAEGVCSTYGD